MKTLAALLAAYAIATLVHFMHNAQFIADYPNLPKTWSATTVYVAWIAMTLIGAAGWALVARGRTITGLLVLAVYAALGLDSLGHYVLAPLSAHTFAMNATILVEVSAAACVMLEVARQLAAQVLRPTRAPHPPAPPAR